MRLALICAAVVLIVLVPVARAAEIHDAATSGDLDAVRAIVSADSDQATAKDVRNDTPLHLAVGGGHIDIVRYLLDAGVPVDIGDNENTTPLGIAAISGFAEIGELLMERGADVTFADDNGATPLHWSIYNGQAAFASMLIDRGADVTAAKANGSTPLHGASFYNHPDCVRLLLDHGANVNARTTGLYTPVLSAVAGMGELEVVRTLAEAGADIHDRNDWGESTLMLAARTGKADAAEYLIEQGVSIWAKSNRDGRTAIHEAAGGGQMDILRMLVDEGADINEKAHDGWTALTFAVIRSQPEAAIFLLEQGAETEVEDQEGATPLLRALRSWSPELVAALLDHGADVNVRDAHAERTFLHQTALRGMLDGVELALAHGADVDAVDAAGKTALQYASKYGHRTVADVLKKGGAKAKGLEENYGRSPLLDRAVDDGQVSMWHLGHCGWALKTDKHFLIFDYWNPDPTPETPGLVNGHINCEEIEGENVYVFVTHEHQDHFDPVIFEWADKLPNVTYVFGFRPELQPPYRQEGYNGPEYEYVGPREHVMIDGMDIRTIAANDAGVGFLIEIDGLVLYHAGDHAGWAEGERDGYFAEIDYLDPFVKDLDMAFVNVTGCHAHNPEALKEGNIYTIETFRPKLIIPTHASGREHVYMEAADEARKAGIETPFCCPANRGDCYFYSRGELM